jgi:hypothetical protein
MPGRPAERLVASFGPLSPLDAILGLRKHLGCRHRSAFIELGKTLAHAGLHERRYFLIDLGDHLSHARLGESLFTDRMLALEVRRGKWGRERQ